MIFIRFTDKSRRSVEAAFEEARMLGHDSVGDEDILLGILRAEEGVAAEVLSSLGVTLDSMREMYEDMQSDALASIGISLEEMRQEAGEALEISLPPGRRLPLSPRGKKVLARARREMRTLGDNHLGPEHVLLGILREEDAVAVRMLARAGVSPEALEDLLYEMRGRTAG